jgi:hypothetical protein
MFLRNVGTAYRTKRRYNSEDHNTNHSFGSRRIFLLICPVSHFKMRYVRYKTVVTYVTLEENWCDIDKSKKTLNVAIHLDRNMQTPDWLTD